jgi:predicted kinase
MKLKRSALDAPSSALIDAMMDAYVCWREECAAVEKAYRDWLGARRDDKADAFAKYSAALDREEYAAAEYRRLIEDAESHVSMVTTPTAAR